VEPETGKKARFTSSARAAVVQKVPEGHRGVALLYLHGLSTGTSSGPRGFFGRQPDCRHRDARGYGRVARRHRAFMSRTSPPGTTSTSFATGPLQTCALEEERLCCLVISASARRHERARSRSKTAIGSHRLLGSTLATFATAACEHPSSASETGRSASGLHFRDVFPRRPENNAVGCTRSRTSSTHCAVDPALAKKMLAEIRDAGGPRSRP